MQQIFILINAQFYGDKQNAGRTLPALLYVFFLHFCLYSLTVISFRAKKFEGKFPPLSLRPTNSLFCGRAMTFAIRKSSCKPACGAAAHG